MQHVINRNIINDAVGILFFPTKSLKTGIFHTSGASQFRPATFPVPNSHLWLVALYFVSTYRSALKE